MRQVTTKDIIDPVALELTRISSEVDLLLQARLQAAQEEPGSLASLAIAHILENQQLAQKEHLPLCQDTGMVVFFVTLGSEVALKGNLVADLNEAVRVAYERSLLRKSVVRHPLVRVNTTDNTPAVVHIELVPGDQLKILMGAKGGGSENMSALAMLTPSQGEDGVVDFVLKTIKQASGSPCPPLVVGVGIGGTMEVAALLAKKSLFRELGAPASDPDAARLEQRLLTEINQLRVGPLGFGGKTTAVAVHVDLHPCHIASLPVAVNLNCHAHRHGEVVV